MSTMIEILQRIIETRGKGCKAGLCYELDPASDFNDLWLRDAFETWEHYSGCWVHPVPDPELPGDPKAAQKAFYRAGKYSQFVGPYGELRLDLARHLLKELSK